MAQETNSHIFSPDTGTFSVMSVSSLPEWKQLLLERKRREEEARERKEKQEEEKFASMPAWKRGIIQRRKAKQDSFGDREKEKEVCLLPVDFRSPSDGLSDTDSSLTLNLGSEVSFSPDPGIWLDADIKPGSQVSVETIVPVHENPFMRTQSSWRKGREADGGSDFEIKEREKDKSTSRSQEGESGKGRDIEFKIEKFRDLSAGRDRSQGRERDNSRGRWEKEKSQWKDSGKDAVRDREFLKLKKDEEEKEKNLPCSSSSPLGPCLRTIRADNIIIIEQDRKSSDERKGRWRDTERERPEDDHQGKRGMKMDLRDIFAGGGNVTEIRASEVLIIKPSESSEERNATGGQKGLSREDGEMKAPLDGRWESTARELKTDMSWLREKEKERPWGQATVIKEDRKDSMDDSVFLDRGGRVSQLLSKFGQHPKPPSRSKSSDNFLRPGRRKFSEEEDEHQSEGNWRSVLFKGAPKRSFSFSERVICANENGLDDNGYYEKKTRERSQSEKDIPPWVDAARLSNDTKSNFKLGCARLLDKDRFARYRERHLKSEENKTEGATTEVWKIEPLHAKTSNRVEDDGFTVATVKNTEGISFAKRVPIRQDGRAKEANRVVGETLERKSSVEKEPEVGGQLIFDKKAPDFLRENAIDYCTVTPDTAQRSYAVAASSELTCSGNTTHSLCRHGSAFTECLSMHCPQDHIRASEWSSAGPQRPYSVLSQHTEDLISKIEKIGDTTVYNNEKGDRLFKPAYEVTKDRKDEGQMQSKTGSENPTHDVAPRSPKRIASMGIPVSPLEIQIPRSVFYVAEDLENKKAEVQTSEGEGWEGGTQVERRDSWRIGKPLSRIESLREKIRQRELEKRRQRKEQDGVCGGNAETIVSHAAGDWQDEKGTEKQREAENTAEIRNRLCDAESGQENAAVLTSTTAFDVTQEVSMLQTYPQLPSSVQHSRADRDEEATCEYVTATSEIVSGRFYTEDNPEENVEQQLRDLQEDKDPLKELEANQEDSEDEEAAEEVEEEEEERKGLSEEELEEYTSSHKPDSLADMSRIYNLEKIGSRSGLCLKERPVDRPSVHLVTVKPLIPNSHQRENKTNSGDDLCGVQAIQRQIEQFQLREQEVLKSSTSASIVLKGKETKAQHSPKGLLKHQVTEDTLVQKNDQDTSILKVTPQRVLSPTSQLKQQQSQTIGTSPTALRSQSPDNNLKPSDYTPTPASSPMSPSPVQSPSISPSPSPSPTLFTIRSASGGGGKGKRGATITITPRKPAGSEGPTAVSGSTTGPTAAVATPGKTVSQQAQTTSTAAEPTKKKYPTVEEIEVIGGYQSLERSCLVKNRGTPKRVSGILQKRDN